MSKKTFIDLIVIVSLITLNIIIKSLYLGDYNIDLDEPFTIYHAQGSLWDITKLLWIENNPPLFFVILHFWIKIFGISAISTRFLPMLFSSFAVLFVYKIGRKYINIWAAIGASLLYTFSNENIGQAHDTRVYTLFVLLTAASMYFYFSIIDAERKRKYLVGLTITNVLLMYAHFLAIFVLFLQTLYILSIPSIRKKIIKEYILSSKIIILCYLPYLCIFLIRLFWSVHSGLWTPKSEISYLYSYLTAYCNYLYLTENLFLGILVIFVVILFFTRKKLKLTVYQIMIIGWFIIPYLLMFLISYKIPILTPLYMIFFIPGFYLTVMLAISYVTDVLADKLGKYIRIMGVVMTILCLYYMLKYIDLNYSYGFQGAKVVTIVRENKTDSTAVFLVPPWTSLTFTYHYDINAFKDFGNYEKHLNVNNIFVVSTVKDIDTSHLTHFSNALLLDGWHDMKIADPNKTILHMLKQRFGNMDTLARLNSCDIYNFGPITLRKNNY
jgi:mannosyltransferase